MSNIVKAQLRAFNKHDSKSFAACYAANAVIADPQFTEPLKGSSAIAKDIEDWFGSFPNITSSLTRTVVNGADFAAEWTMSGIHEGPLVTPEGHVPATGKSIRLVVVTIGRVDEDGKIVEERRAYDLASVMSQLGLMH